MGSLYTDTKVFHFHDKLRDLDERRWSAPIHVRLKPTNRCNHRCSYCCYRSPSLYLGQRFDDRDEIPPQRLREIIDDIIKIGVRAVTFSGGGEPLCHPNFAGAVDRLVDGGVAVATLTNGELLEGERAEALAAGATWVRISMDAADNEGYTSARGARPGTFDRICENIRRFLEIRSPGCRLGISFIVTRENHRQIAEFVQIMRDLGVDHVKLSECVVATTPEGNRDYLAPILEEVRAQVDLARTLEDESFAVVDRIHYEFRPGDQYTKAYDRCPFLECLTVIAADLNVYTCQDKAYAARGLLGSLAERSFAEAWESDDLRARARGIAPCRDCDHHCVAHGKNLILLDYLGADCGHVAFV